MSTAKGTPFDDLFASLTEKMGIPHTASPDTDPSQRERVEWDNNGGTGLEPIGYTIPGTVTIGRQGVEYQVSVHGSSELEVLTRAGEIAGWLDVLIGPPQGAPPPAGNGFKVGKLSKPVRGGDGISAGYACVVPITLYLPVFSEVRPMLIVGEVDLTATALAGQGASNDGVMSGAVQGA